MFSRPLFSPGLRAVASTALVFAVAVALADPLPQKVLYEGDATPDVASPDWLTSASFPPVGNVENDANAEDGFAYELDAFRRMSWTYDPVMLANLDPATGWSLTVRHHAMLNQKPTLAQNYYSDQNDTIFVSDGKVSLAIDFRPGEVRIQSVGAPNGTPCASRPLTCAFFTVPAGEYVTVTVRAQHGDWTAWVNGLPPHHGFEDAGSAKDLTFGSTVTGEPGASLARWDYIRLDMRGPNLIDAGIDIKPGSFPNSVNLRSRGVIPVAVLGGASLDVSTVLASSVTFGPGDAAPAHGGHLEDVNGDGVLDLVLHFRTREVALEPDAEQACIAGETADGFIIEGCDSVRVVG